MQQFPNYAHCCIATIVDDVRQQANLKRWATLRSGNGVRQKGIRSPAETFDIGLGWVHLA